MNVIRFIRTLLRILSRVKPPRAQLMGIASSGLTVSTAPTGRTAETAPRPSVSATASVTFGPNSCAALPRSQVLSLLRSDCSASTRRIELLVLHCTDTRPDQRFSIRTLQACHRQRGFGEWPGYHLYVRRDGTLYYCRPVGVKGCHVSGKNWNSIGLCYEGGHSSSPEYKYEDNRTAEQLVVLDEVLRVLHDCYPEARIVGHHELNPAKACPCLDPPASVEYAYIFGRQ